MLTLPDALPEWQRWGACQYTDPEAFFPNKGESPEPAQRVCVRCEVRPECLEWALETDQMHGVWGGLTARQRRRILRKRAATRAADGAA